MQYMAACDKHRNVKHINAVCINLLFHNHCKAQYGPVLPSIAQYGQVQPKTAQYSSLGPRTALVQPSAAGNSPVQPNMAQALYRSVQLNRAQYSPKTATT